jgi:uncharacterized protein (DUF736 family)
MAEEKPKSKWQENELGALWKQQGRNQKFLSGKIKIDGVETDLIIFANDKKEEGSRAPDFRIYKSEPREGAGAATQKESAPADDIL